MERDCDSALTIRDTKITVPLGGGFSPLERGVADPGRRRRPHQPHRPGRSWVQRPATTDVIHSTNLRTDVHLTVDNVQRGLELSSLLPIIRKRAILCLRIGHPICILHNDHPVPDIWASDFASNNGDKLRGSPRVGPIWFRAHETGRRWKSLRMIRRPRRLPPQDQHIGMAY